MYVCVCNAINCRTVKRVVQDGATSIAGVFKAAGKSPQCGRCFPTVRGMIEEHRCCQAPAGAVADAALALAAE